MKSKLELQFAGRLRLLLEQRGVNSSQLADAVGLSHVSIGNFLNGQLPKSKYLAALAEFFGVTTDWLLGCDLETLPANAKKNPGHPVDDVLAEFETVKKKMESLERALQRLKHK